MRSTLLRQQDLFIDTLRQGEFVRPRQTSRFTESDTRAAYLGRRRLRTASLPLGGLNVALNASPTAATLLSSVQRSGGNLLPSLRPSNRAGTLTLSPLVTPLKTIGNNRPFKTPGRSTMAKTPGLSTMAVRRWGTSSAPSRGFNLEPDPFADEGEEPCVHCPGSVSGAQGSDLMTAKRRMKKSPEAFGSPFGTPGGLGSRAITYSG